MEATEPGRLPDRECPTAVFHPVRVAGGGNQERGLVIPAVDFEMVEARGIEPLSGTPSTMVSTRLASGLVFRSDWARLRRCPS